MWDLHALLWASKVVQLVGGFPQSRTVATPMRRSAAGWYASGRKEVT
jgi:hypothetical protein